MLRRQVELVGKEYYNSLLLFFTYSAARIIRFVRLIRLIRLVKLYKQAKQAQQKLQERRENKNKGKSLVLGSQIMPTK